MRHLLLATCVVATAGPASVFSQSTVTGEWKAQYASDAGKAIEARVVIDGETGTWHLYPWGIGAVFHYPCAGRDLPMTVQSTGDDLKLVVNGSQILPGCDFTATFKRVDDNTFDGKFGSARPLHLTRK